MIEYSYWLTTSILGGQDYPGRAEELRLEWKATTRELVQQRDLKAYRLFTSSEFNVPRVLPEGKYTGPTMP